MRPAVDYRRAAGLQRAVDFLCAVETGVAGEEDSDVGYRMRECVVCEVQGFAFLVRDADGPVVLFDGVLEGGEEGWVDICCVDLDVFWCARGGEDEARYGAGAAGVVMDDGAVFDGWDESEVVRGELCGYETACCFVC